jgi:hypothetical protein
VCRGSGLCSATQAPQVVYRHTDRRTLSWKGLINVNHSLHNNKYSLHNNRYNPMKFKCDSRNDYINKTWAIFLNQGTTHILFKNTECCRQSDRFDRQRTAYCFGLVLGFSGFESRAVKTYFQENYNLRMILHVDLIPNFTHTGQDIRKILFHIHWLPSPEWLSLGQNAWYSGSLDNFFCK